MVPAPKSRQALAWIAIAGFAIVAAFLARDAVGVPSTIWMWQHHPKDFPGLRALADFLWTTRLPMPPILTAAEIVNYQLDGTTDVVTRWLYRFCLVASYVLVLVLARRSLPRLGIALVLSLVFLQATIVVHATMAFVYDLVLPALLLAFFVCLDAASPGRRNAALACFLAGLCLAMAELTRPYVLLLLPLLLIGAAARLWSLPGRARIAFLAPLLVLSGGWHLHQYIDLGQIAWSNHGGFNLLNAWPMIAVPPLREEPTKPARPGAVMPIDNPVHGENSQRIVAAVASYVANNPVQAAIHVGERVADLLSARTEYLDQKPQHWILPLYGVLVRYAGLCALLAAALVMAAMILRPQQIGATLGKVDNLIPLVATANLVVLAVADHGEEARFLLSALPLLALPPLPSPEVRALAGAWSRRRIGLAAAAAIVGVLAIEILVHGAERHPTGPAEGRMAALPATPAAVPKTIRVLALTIRGRHWHGDTRDIVERCLAQADIAGLLEVSGGDWWGEQDQAASLGGSTGMTHAYAPSERRWWRDQTGIALLSRLPGTTWRRIPLPTRRDHGPRTTLIGALTWGERSVAVAVADLDSNKPEAQFEAVADLFENLPTPALLIGRLYQPRDTPGMAKLLAQPGTVAILNDLPSDARMPSADLILARGFASVSTSRCSGVEDHQPGLILELAPAP